jgi:hypothetical protein
MKRCGEASGYSRTGRGGSTTWLRAWLVLAGLGCAAGCIDEELVSSDEQELYVKGSRIWLALAIPVCWENGTRGNTTERGWVRDKIAATWSASSLVTFTGWGTCGPRQGGLRIRINDEGPHVKQLGRDLDGVAAGMVLNFTFNNWSPTCQSARQFCIETIAVHEFGHALGFAHEQNRPDTPETCTDAPQGDDGDTTIGPFDLSSVMNYCNPTWANGGTLSATDIVGVRQYYGSPTFASNRKAAVVWPNNKVYFFNGSQYTRFDMITERTDSGYPADIAANWHNWPASWSDGIDAGLDWGNGKAYLFRDTQYVRYDIATDAVEAGYPLPIAGNWGNNWPAHFTTIDAAVRWPNGKIFFFHGSEYVRYDIATNQVDPGYPAPIGPNWPGLFTDGIDYGFMYPNGRAYFFQDTQYQRFDPGTNMVDLTLPIVGEWPGVPF